MKICLNSGLKESNKLPVSSPLELFECVVVEIIKSQIRRESGMLVRAFDLPTSALVFVLVFVLESRLRQTVTDMQVTSFPPRRQSLLKMLTFSGSKVSLAWILTTPRDLEGGSMLSSGHCVCVCLCTCITLHRGESVTVWGQKRPPLRKTITL